MTHVSTHASEEQVHAPSLLRIAGFPYFLIAFIARLPFAMMVVGVLTVVVSARGSLSLGGLTSAAVGLGTACFGPLLGAAADRFFGVLHHGLVDAVFQGGRRAAEGDEATGLRLHGKGCLFQDMGEGQRAAWATRVQLTNGGEPGPQALLEPRQVVD